MASEADLNTELLIRDRLKAAFPKDAFFGEETGRAEVEERRAFGSSIRSTGRNPHQRHELVVRLPSSVGSASNRRHPYEPVLGSSIVRPGCERPR